MNLEQLKNRINNKNIKVISFDVFDTLLLRPCIEPTDMFRLVANRCGLPVEFVTVRRKAEEIARSNKPYYNDDITFEDIYDEFVQSLGYSRNEADKIKQVELDVELEYLRPRKSMQYIFNEALKEGKIIIICSDMYHSSEFLARVLNKNNYYGFSEIYVSSEYKLSKGSKRLFKQIINDFKNKDIKAKEILHIGDNYISDIKNSRSIGMQAEYIESVRSRFENIRELSVLHKHITAANNLGSDNTFLIGYIANIIFDDPYVEFDNSTYFNGDLNNISNILLAPLIFTFVKWMLEDCIKEEIDKLCLIYRDGYLIEKIINILKPYYKNIPEIKRLRLSRRALRCFEGKNEHGFILDAVSNPVNPKMKLDEYLDLRVFAKDNAQKNTILNEIKHIGYNSLNDNVGPIEKQLELARNLEEYFIDNSNIAMEAVEKYCKNQIGSFKYLAIFDIGYSGRIHKLLRSSFGIENKCYHIFGYDYLKPKFVGIKSFQYISSSFTNKSMVIHNAFFEDVISEQVPSVSRIIENNGDFEFIYDEGFSINNNMVKLQNLILQFCEGFSKNFSKDLSDLNFEGFDFYEIYKKFLDSPDKKDAELLCNFDFQDNWITGYKWPYYKIWYNKKFNNTKDIEFHDYSDENDIRIKVKKILKTLHLFKPAKKIYLKIKSIKTKNFEKRKIIMNMNKAMEDSKNEINSYDNNGHNLNNIVILGHIASFDKGVCSYLKNISNMAKEFNFVLLSETPHISVERVKELVDMKSFIIPRVAFSNGFDKEVQIPISIHVKDILKQNRYLEQVSLHLSEQFTNMSKTYADNLAVYFYDYCVTALNKFNPEKVIIWNQFSAMHEVMANLCREKKIPIIFMEFGVLPGTFAIDSNGQMGESLVSINYTDFLNQPVSDKEILDAKKVIDFIKKTKLNRNIQPINNIIKEIKDKLKADRPTILVFGQSDYESGLCPYTENTKKYHSPIVKSSDESLRIIAKIAKENNYNIIYKPHPGMKYLNKKFEIPSHVIIVDDVSIHDLIELSDVVVTVLSQTSYESLIKGIPVLMLGYNQLKGKGCTYEAFEYDAIEINLKNAIRYGFTEQQKSAFNKHVAQLLKYYLFDDMVKKDIKIGRNMDDFLKLLNS